MAAAALASIVLILAASFVRLDLQQRLVVYLADLGIVAVFAVEFTMRLNSEKKRLAFLKGQWYEVFAMLPVVLFVALEAEPYLGATFRSLRIVRVLRLVGITSRLMKLARIT